MFKKTLTMALFGAAAIIGSTNVAHANPCASKKGGFFAGVFVGAGSSKATVEKLGDVEVGKIEAALDSNTNEMKRLVELFNTKLEDHKARVTEGLATNGAVPEENLTSAMAAVIAEQEKDKPMSPDFASYSKLAVNSKAFEAKGLTTVGLELGGSFPFADSLVGLVSIYGGYDFTQEGLKLGLRAGLGYYVTSCVILGLSAIAEAKNLTTLAVPYTYAYLGSEFTNSFSAKLDEWVLGFAVSPSITYEAKEGFYVTVSYDFFMFPDAEHKAKIDVLAADKAKITEATLKASYIEHRIVARAGMRF